MIMIKKTNDFILGILMTGVGMFLLFSSKIVTNISMNDSGGYFARADVYVKMLGAILALSSIILIIKSLGFDKNKLDKKNEPTKFNFDITDTVCYIILSMVIYAVFLPLIGFKISTFVMLFYLCMLFSIKEQNKKLNKYTKQEVIKIGIRSFIYSLISVIVLYFVFTKGLNVQLP